MDPYSEHYRPGIEKDARSYPLLIPLDCLEGTIEEHETFTVWLNPQAVLSVTEGTGALSGAVRIECRGQTHYWVLGRLDRWAAILGRT